MSSPISEPMPASRGLSGPVAQPLPGADMPAPGLAISGVSRTYQTDDGPVAALGPVDLDVPQGRFVTLIGPSGCGKSTLLRVLAGIERPDEGTISIFGESVERRQAKLIGFVPQALALLPWRTVLDNARLPLELNRSGAASRRKPARDPSEVLRAFGLGDVLDRRPAELSGGMRQRVAIARAFRLRTGPFAHGRAVLRSRRAHKRRIAPRAPPAVAFDAHHCVVR